MTSAMVGVEVGPPGSPATHQSALDSRCVGGPVPRMAFDVGAKSDARDVYALAEGCADGPGSSPVADDSDLAEAIKMVARSHQSLIGIGRGWCCGSLLLKPHDSPACPVPGLADLHRRRFARPPGKPPRPSRHDPVGNLGGAGPPESVRLPAQHTKVGGASAGRHRGGPWIVPGSVN